MNTTPDANEASPDVYEVLLSNDHVNILEMKLAPAKIDNWHRHPPESVYFIKGGKLRIHLPDGESISKEIPDGGVMWHEAWTHRVENVGDTTVHAIIVEDKRGDTHDSR